MMTMMVLYGFGVVNVICSVYKIKIPQDPYLAVFIVSGLA